MQRKKNRTLDLDSTLDHPPSSPAITVATTAVVAETTLREFRSSPSVGGAETHLAPASAFAETVSTATSVSMASRPAKVVAVVSSAPLPPHQQVPMPSGYGTSEIDREPQPSTVQVQGESESVMVREASSEEGMGLHGPTSEQAGSGSPGASFEVVSNVSSEAEMKSGGSGMLLSEPLVVCDGSDSDKTMQVTPSDEAMGNDSGTVTRSSPLSVDEPNFADSSEEALDRASSPQQTSTGLTISHSLDVVRQEVGVVDHTDDAEKEVEMEEEGVCIEEEGEVEGMEEEVEMEERRHDVQEEATMEYADTTHMDGMCVRTCTSVCVCGSV